MSGTLNKSLSRVLKARRLQLGLSQERLAGLCDLDRTYISSMERGKRNLTFDTLEKIVAVMEISSIDFLKLLIKDLSNVDKA